MVDLATMPDIEELLTANLVVGSPAVDVTTKTPNEQSGAATVPDEFVRVERVGGVKASPITDAPTVVAEAWAKDEAAAAQLMQKLRHALWALAGTTVAGVKVNEVEETGGVLNLPDPLGAYERYTVTVTLHVRGAIT